MDKSVLEGFHDVVKCTLKYFLVETEFVKGNPEPFYEAQLQLNDDDLNFVPSMTVGTSDGFYEMIEGLIKNVYFQGALIPRIAPHLKQENYKVNSRYLLWC